MKFNYWFNFIIVIFVTGIFLIGCEKNNNPIEENSSNPYNQLDPPSNSFTTNLIAGRTIDVGDVSVWNDDDNLYIKYETTDNWWLTETHLHVATSLAGIPQTGNGNPIPGQFRFKHEGLNCTLIDHYSIPLTDIDPNWNSDDTLFIATHAAVVLKDNNGNIIQSETAWGIGLNFPGNNWAMYFNYPPPGCESTFGYNQTYSTCFKELFVAARGCTNGPLSNGTYTFDIYAYGVPCEPNYATLVGTLTVNYTGSSVTVNYSMNFGFTMDETHLYVGNEQLPPGRNVDPEQYPYIHENLNGTSTDSYTVSVNGNIYVIAHAVVCGAFE